MMNLAELRKAKGASSAILNKLAQAAESTGTKEDDKRFWKLERDKAGNGSATIRFLPGANIEVDLPWVKYFNHAFKGPTGKWYIENSLTTFGEADPAAEANKELWDTGIESNKKLASERKRKLNYVSNILVVKDPAHPENEGKVFLFKYGKTIFEMITEKLNPTFGEDEKVDVFNLWDGANLKLRMHVEDKFPKYTKSAWSELCPVAEDDEEIVNILNQRHNLSDILDRKNFKSYDELKKRLDMVLNTKGVAPASAESMLDSIGDEDDAPPPKATKKKAAKAEAPKDEDEDEDVASFFQQFVGTDE